MSSTFDPPKYNYGDNPSYWVYHPTKGVPTVFAVLFLISGFLHVYQNVYKSRSWRIAFLLPWAATLFVAGFILREIGAEGQYWNLPIFISSQVLIFCAPPVYSGACYFIFGRLLYYIPYLSLIHPGRVFSTFIGLDAVVETLSAQGIARATNRGSPPANIRAGIALIKASLFLALALFLAFITLIIHFHRACKANNVLTPNIRIIIFELYTASFFILFRNTFRTASFFYIYTDTANSSEAVFYCFEIVPMLICTYIFNAFPPAKYLPSNYKIYLAKDGKTELEGPGKLDCRPMWASWIDPCDVAGLFTGRDQKTRFWDEDGIGGPKSEAPVADEGLKWENDILDNAAPPDVATGKAQLLGSVVVA